MKYYKYLLLLSSFSTAFATQSLLSNDGLSENGYFSSQVLSQNQNSVGGALQERFLGGLFDHRPNVRCYYNSPNKVGANLATDYILAIDPKTRSKYMLDGYWDSAFSLTNQNIYFTDVSSDKVNQLCSASLEAQNKGKLVGVYAAATGYLLGGSFSNDYMIWYNNTGSESGAYDKIVSFGDSLTDTHNLYNAVKWVLPNNNSWFLGRLSNGPTWVEYLAKSLNLPLYNLAVSGSILKNFSLGVIATGTLSGQVDRFIKYANNAKNYDPKKTLFTIWIGGNDLVFNTELFMTDELIDRMDSAISKLIGIGAQNIIVLNLPDVSTVPLFQSRSDGVYVSGKVVDVNLSLATFVNNLQNTNQDLNIQLVDLYQYFGALLNNPASYGISDYTSSCLEMSTTQAFVLHAPKKRKQCLNPNTFLFWDTIHPTTAVHKIIGDNVFNLIK